MTAAFAVALAIGAAGSHIAPLRAVSTSVVISQIYGGGGNAGATFKNDFIELYNRGAATVSLAGWSVQYNSAAGTGAWQVTALGNVLLQAGEHYLIQEAAGAGGTVSLPTPDTTGSIPMSATAGRVALVSSTAGITGTGCPPSASIVDLVGYGSGVSCSEGAAAPAPSNTNAIFRAGGGATDTDNNAAEFTAGPPVPHNCSTCSSLPPSGTGSTSPIAVNPGEPILLKVTVTPGTNPTSAGLTVTANLSSLGGSAAQAFFDDASNGDATAGDNVFSYLWTTSAASAVGPYVVPFTVSDNLARMTNGSLTVNLQVVGPQDVVISQVYGGGGNTGATFKNDFIELFNRGTNVVSVTGWSVQYQSAAGSGAWQVTTLSGTLGPGQYYLVQQAQGGAGTAALPVPDASGAIAMAATAGKVALVSNSAALSGACPLPSDLIVDLVGFGGAASCVEGGGPASAPSNTTAVRRRGGTGGCTDTDNNTTDFFTGAPFPRNSAVTGSCVVPPALPLAIHDIQGTTGTSAYAGQAVATTGVVTARKTNGFFLQAPDSEVDGDSNTSEGVFVFTSSTPPADAAVGSYVGVTGTVQEFIPSADPYSPSVTEIGFPTVTLFTPGFGLPSAVVLTVDDANPAGGLDNLEKFEGMRVSIPSLTVVAPTQGNVNEAGATASTTGVFYGVITGVARPMREPGVQVPDPLPAGSPAGVPRYDANPERIRVDSDALGGAAVTVTTGAVVTGLVGPLDYSFRTYTVLQEAATPPAISGNIAAIPVPAPNAREFTVASFNTERFFDTVNDPAKDDVALTAQAFQNRLAKASLAIRNVMRLPDVIGVEEMENLETLQAVADRVNADAAAGPGPAPHYEARLLEGNDIGGIDVGFLVNGDRVTIIGDAEQIGAEATYVPPGGGSALLNDRPSLQVHAVVHVPGAAPFPVTIIVNHLRSLSGVDDPADGNRVRTKRRAQAEDLATYVQSRQDADPQERIVLVGDFNAFTFSDGYVDVMGTIKGTPAPADQVVLASADLVNPDLVDLVETAGADQQYSFVFDGVAQELDHVLVTQNLLPYLSRFEYARNNADFPEVYRNDATRPERISDHDMIVAYFELPLEATLAYTGQTTATIGEPLSLSASVAGPASGDILFTLGAQTATGGIAGGRASAGLGSVDGPRGVRTLSVAFAGDGVYAPASATASIAVSEATALSLPSQAANAGSPVAITATLSAASGALAGEALTFTVDGQSYTAVTDAGGIAAVTVSQAIAGTYPLTVSYAGNPSQFLLASSAASTLQVSQATALSYTGPVSAVTGLVSVSALLSEAPGGAPIAGETIVFTVGATTRSAATGATGVASASFSLGAGTYPVTAAFAGDPSTFRLASSASGSLAVLNRPPVATPDTASTLENVPVTVPVLANDGDPDGGLLAVAAVTPPLHGTATPGGGGVVYQPAANFAGTDTFTYTVSDGQGGTASATVTVAISRTGRFVAFSRDFTFLGDNTVVHSGDVGANAARAHDHDHDRDNRIDRDDVTVWLDEGARMESPGSRIVGDVVQLDRRASAYDLWDNALLNHKGTILGATTTPLPLPVLSMPAFPAVTPGTHNVTVNGGTLTLPPGSYGRVTVKNRGTLVLTGGLYQLLSLDLDDRTTVMVRGASEIRIEQDLDGESRVRFVVDPSVAGLRASQVLVYVKGADRDAHHRFGDAHAPTIVEFGDQSVIQANIYAGNGSVRFGDGVVAAGAFIGLHVRIGDRCELTLDGAFR